MPVEVEQSCAILITFITWNINELFCAVNKFTGRCYLPTEVGPAEILLFVLCHYTVFQHRLCSNLI